MMEEIHKPVLLHEVVQYLEPKRGQSYLDLTAGYGGHASAILDITENFKGSFLNDRDDFALSYLRRRFAGRTSEIQIHKGDFLVAAEKLVAEGKTFDLILADLGVSSPQLDMSERGFSFVRDGDLDMRMDQEQGLSAAGVVNEWRREELVRIFTEYGEEREGFAEKVAREIIQNRPIESTVELAGIISGGKKWHGRHPATKIFQAIRIAVNDELREIEETLKLLPSLLNPGGRVAIISFHSLEDRIVKRYFKNESEKGVDSEFKILTKSPVIAGKEELVINPRSRSAKLRVAEKI